MIPISTNALTKMNKSDIIGAVVESVPVLAFDWTPGSVENMTEADLLERGDALRQTDDNLQGMLTVFRSQATYVAKFVTDSIGEGKRFATATEYAASIGVSKSHVTRLTRLGRAVQVHAVDPRSELWSGLTRVANDSKAVREMLDSGERADHMILAGHVAEALAKQSADKDAAAAKREADKVAGQGSTGETPGEANVPTRDLFSVLYNRLANVASGSNPVAAQEMIEASAKFASACIDALAELAASAETVQGETA